MKKCLSVHVGRWVPVILSVLALQAMHPCGGMAFTIESAVGHALQHNPELLANRAAIAEARGARETAGRLAAPQLVGEIAPEASTSGNGRISLGITQPFPLTGRLRIQQGVNDRLVEQAVADVREAERQLAGQVRLRCVELLAARQQLAVHARQLTNTQAQLEWVARNARLAEGSSLDVAQVETEYQQLAARRLGYEGAERERQWALGALLGLPAGTPCELAGELQVPAVLDGEHPEIAAAERSDYQAAQARVAVAQSRVELARASRWEDALAGLFTEHERYNDRPVGRVRDDWVGLRFSVPLPLRRRALDTEPQARATRERRILESAAVLRQVQWERALARQQMVQAARQARSQAEELLPAARRLEERLQTARTTGQGAMGDVLRARERRLQLEMTLVEMIRDYYLAEARWRTATETTASTGP